MVKNLPEMQDTQEMWVLSLCGEDPLEEGMATPPISLQGKSHGQRSLVGYGSWGHKESDMTEVTEPLSVCVCISIYMCLSIISRHRLQRHTV